MNLNHQILRDVAVVASESHNLEVGGSNPSPATIFKYKVMGEKKLRTIGPGTLNQVVKDANENLVQKEDIVEFITLPNGYILVYYG